MMTMPYIQNGTIWYETTTVGGNWEIKNTEMAAPSAANPISIWVFGLAGNDEIDFRQDISFTPLANNSVGHMHIVGGPGEDKFYAMEDVGIVILPYSPHEQYTNWLYPNIVFEGGDQNDTLVGGANAEWFIGGNGIDTADAYEGENWLDGNGDNDVLHGGPDRDWIGGGPGGDELDGGGDQDEINGQEDNDAIQGGPGEDIIWGGSGAYSIWGGDDFDVISAGDGNDRVWGGDDNSHDTISTGYSGLVGTLFPEGQEEEYFELVYGGGGDDTIIATLASGPVYVEGGDHLDTIEGSAFDDRIFGGGGNDVIHGNGGNDYIYGDDGNDTLYGDAGVDYIEGGTGGDTLYGGAGTDWLVSSQYGNADGAIDTMFGKDESGDTELDYGWGWEDEGDYFDWVTGVDIWNGFQM